MNHSKFVVGKLLGSFHSWFHKIADTYNITIPETSSKEEIIEYFNTKIPYHNIFLDYHENMIHINSHDDSENPIINSLNLYNYELCCEDLGTSSEYSCYYLHY